MDCLVDSLPADLRARLKALADRTDRTVEQCLEHAVFEFIENWEVHLRDVQRIEAENAERPLLRVVND